MDASWILSGQSPLQKRIITKLPPKNTCYIDGPACVYVRDIKVRYILLSTSSMHSVDEEWIDQREIHDYSDLRSKLYDLNAENEPSIHHQSDMTILALAVLQQNTQQNVSSWISQLYTP